MTQIDTRTLTKQTADTLLTEGIRPTVANVRARTGQGSAGTINAALQEWWQELANRLLQLETRPEIPEPVFTVAEQAWETALKQAETLLAKERKKLQQEQEASKAAVKIAQQTQQAAEQKIGVLTKRLETLEEVRLILERQLASEKVRTENLSTQMEELQVILEQKKQTLGEQAERYEIQLTREREQWASLEQHLVIQLDEQKVLRKQQENSLVQRESQWREREEKLQFRQQSALIQLTQTQEKLKGLKENLQAIKTETQSFQQEREQWMSKIARLETEKKHTASEQIQLRAQTVELKEQVETLTLQREKLSEQLRQMESQQTAYEAENRTLQALLKQWKIISEQNYPTKNP
ncbi:DNA-binding protein [Nitrosococcus wardiae]|uniref:DNA-binding protein n=1 Tax=Nitrosococcus wardiae TaxID=1814290 RepID=A0A4P7C1P3_9GAMM|nr:DNA-binding protein [Nitrosococcus wardiae]QBQ55384.1 DNA-binding protein [Nitrosococcus wardiae]